MSAAAASAASVDLVGTTWTHLVAWSTRMHRNLFPSLDSVNPPAKSIPMVCRNRYTGVLPCGTGLLSFFALLQVSQARTCARARAVSPGKAKRDWSWNVVAVSPWCPAASCVAVNTSGTEESGTAMVVSL